MQRLFLEHGLKEDPEYTVLGYAGGRSAGKSYATALLHMLVALKYPLVKTLILRRGQESVVVNYRDTILTLARQLGLEKAFRYYAKHYFKVANGSFIYLGFIDDPRDYEKYLGSEYGLISLTEASQHSEDRWDDLSGSNRAGMSDYVPRMTLDTNPGGKGAGWIEDRFGLRDPSTRLPGHLWIPAYIWDCPTALIKNPHYVEQNLKHLPAWQRKQWIFGRFDVLAGSYFRMDERYFLSAIPENPAVAYPTEDPPGKITIPRWAQWWGGVDYGDASPFAVLFGARWTDPYTGRTHMHIVREIYQANLDLDEQAFLVQETEDRLRQEGLLHGNVVYYADPSVGRATPMLSSSLSRSIAEIWRRCGFYTRPARSNERIPGWKLIKHLLYRGELTIDRSCKALRGEMAMAVVEGAPGPPKSEDIQQGPNIKDHALDALRYLIVSTFRRAGGALEEEEEFNARVLAAYQASTTPPPRLTTTSIMQRLSNHPFVKGALGGTRED